MRPISIRPSTLRQATWLALLGGLWVGPALAADCEHRAERNLEVDVGTFRTLALVAAAGELELRGEAGLQTIMVRGIACASEADRLDGIQLRQRSEGDRLLVAVEMPDTGTTSGWFVNDYQRLDLDVRVPAQLLLELTDSSGDLRVRDVAGATIQDSSGDIDVEDVSGDVVISDSSGDIDVRAIGGNLRIPSDSSGDIDATGIGGDALVERDSSGDIDIGDVRGNARVSVDSSGSIRLVDIDGDASVGTDSSGSIEARRIGRDFTVERDGGGIRHQQVAGVVRVPDDEEH